MTWNRPNIGAWQRGGERGDGRRGRAAAAPPRTAGLPGRDASDRRALLTDEDRTRLHEKHRQLIRKIHEVCEPICEFGRSA